MSNSIWKTPDQKPKQEELVAWETRTGIHAGRFDTYYNCFCACANYFVDLRKVKRWCSLENLDDLIAQADKAERLQKAVDLALNWLHTIATAHHPTTTYYNLDAQTAIDEIKQLIKE